VSEDGTLFLKKTGRANKSKSAEVRDACLILLYPPGPGIGRRIALTRDEYVVGRIPEVDIVIERDSVSRRHARIVRSDSDGWQLEDLASTNGSFINDTRVTRTPLRDGDQVRFGDAIYKFLAGSNVEAQYHEEIYRMTILDGLTGVHNKRYFLEFLERELSASQRHGQPLSLVMFDIDHFKRINDERGHLAGDAVLKTLAARIKPRIRREDLIARYGGEEFVCVLNGTDVQGARTFAEDLRARVAGEPFEFDGERFQVTISLGVACVHGERGVAIEALVQRADAKLYAAKNGGRNRVASE
jgi:diguanylate cyclase (GGDEF)-like protein